VKADQKLRHPQEGRSEREEPRPDTGSGASGWRKRAEPREPRENRPHLAQDRHFEVGEGGMDPSRHEDGLRGAKPRRRVRQVTAPK